MAKAMHFVALVGLASFHHTRQLACWDLATKRAECDGAVIATLSFFATWIDGSPGATTVAPPFRERRIIIDPTREYPVPTPAARQPSLPTSKDFVRLVLAEFDTGRAKMASIDSTADRKVAEHHERSSLPDARFHR